jgi:hypothetical protein
MLNRVERGLDFELIRFAFHQFANDVLKNADVLRFTNTTDSCLALLPAGQCDFEHFIFFNELFPTAKVHDLWGNALVLAVIQRECDRCLRRCKSRPSGKCICVRKCHHK